MAIQYRIYQNDSAGGPVDESTVIATVSGLTWDTPSLPLNSDTTYLVRSYDTVSGLEEKNTDARVRIRVDAAGLNVSAMPNAPIDLQAEPRAGGRLAVLWQYNPGGQGGAPTGFHVYIGSPTPDYGTPAETYPYVRGRPGYAVELSGLTDGDYQVAVRAYNAASEESNVRVVSATIDGTGPDPVDELSADPA